MSKFVILIVSIFYAICAQADLTVLEDDSLASINGQQGVIIDIDIGTVEIPHLNYFDEEKSIAYENIYTVGIWMFYDINGGLRMEGSRIDVVDYTDLLGETSGGIRFGLPSVVELNNMEFTFGFASAPEAVLDVYVTDPPGSGIVHVEADTRFIQSGGIIVLPPNN